MLATLQLIWAILPQFANPDYSVCIYSSPDPARPLRQWTLTTSVPATQSNLPLHALSPAMYYIATLRDNRRPQESDPATLNPKTARQ